MNWIKKVKLSIILLIFAVLFAAASVTSCGKQKSDEAESENTEEHPADSADHPTSEEHPTDTTSANK